MAAKGIGTAAKVLKNPLVQNAAEGIIETGIETVQTLSTGEKVTMAGIATSLALNSLGLFGGNKADDVAKIAKKADVEEIVGDTLDDLADAVKKTPVLPMDLQRFADKSGSKTTTQGFDEWLNRGNADNKVYFGIKNGEAKYTGITKQSTEVRLAQHNSNGKGFSRLDVQYDGLTRNQARAIEQYFIENGPNELNKINSIGQNNKYYQDAFDWAKQYLGK